MVHKNLLGRDTKLIAGFYVIPESMPPVSWTRATYYADETEGKSATLPADVSSAGVPAVTEQGQLLGGAGNYRESGGHQHGEAVVRDEDQSFLNMHDHFQKLYSRNTDSTVERASRWFNARSACSKGYCPDKASLAKNCDNATPKSHASNECKLCWPQHNDIAIHQHCTITAGRLNLSLLAAFTALLLVILVILTLLRGRVLRYCRRRTQDVKKPRKTPSGLRRLRRTDRRAEEATGSAELSHHGQASLRQRNASLPQDEETAPKAAAAPEPV